MWTPVEFHNHMFRHLPIDVEGEARVDPIGVCLVIGGYTNACHQFVVLDTPLAIGALLSSDGKVADLVPV